MIGRIRSTFFVSIVSGILLSCDAPSSSSSSSSSSALQDKQNEMVKMNTATYPHDQGKSRFFR